MIIVGVDPGMTGAFAVLVDGILADVIDMPVEIRKTGKTKVKFDASNNPRMVEKTANILTAQSVFQVFKTILSKHGTPTAVFLEQVGARPNQSGMFTFGRGVGLIEMAAWASDVPLILVSPNTWQRAVGGSSDKKIACAKASRLYPRHAALFKRTSIDDGRADATLIATYGQGVLDGSIKRP
jgi:crossover junction endodeoxyribonuclease RuvC